MQDPLFDCSPRIAAELMRCDILTVVIERAVNVIGFDLKSKITFGPDYNQAVRDIFDDLCAALALAKGEPAQ